MLKAFRAVRVVVQLWYIPGLELLIESGEWMRLARVTDCLPQVIRNLDGGRSGQAIPVAPEEKAWAATVARRGASLVILLTPLKIFQIIDHFLPIGQIPPTALSYIAKQLFLPVPSGISIDPRTMYRQNTAIRSYLGVTPWGASA